MFFSHSCFIGRYLLLVVLVPLLKQTLYSTFLIIIALLRLCVWYSMKNNADATWAFGDPIFVPKALSS